MKKSEAIETYKTMKKDIHPKNYRLVAFKDMSNEFTFVTKSTASSKETIKLEDGVEYPLIKLEISSTSHPFYTGKMKLVDTAGRVDKFMNRYKTHLDKKKNLKIKKITKDDSIANALEKFKELVELNKESKGRGIELDVDLVALGGMGNQRRLLDEIPGDWATILFPAFGFRRC